MRLASVHDCSLLCVNAAACHDRDASDAILRRERGPLSANCHGKFRRCLDLGDSPALSGHAIAILDLTCSAQMNYMRSLDPSCKCDRVIWTLACPHYGSWRKARASRVFH